MWEHHWTWLGIELELPRIQGHEFGGRVVKVGSDVRNFRAGDRVTFISAAESDLCRSGHYNFAWLTAASAFTTMAGTAVWRGYQARIRLWFGFRSRLTHLPRRRLAAGS